MPKPPKQEHHLPSEHSDREFSVRVHNDLGAPVEQVTSKPFGLVVGISVTADEDGKSPVRVAMSVMGRLNDEFDVCEIDISDATSAQVRMILEKSGSLVLITSSHTPTPCAYLEEYDRRFLHKTFELAAFLEIKGTEDSPDPIKLANRYAGVDVDGVLDNRRLEEVALLPAVFCGLTKRGITERYLREWDKWRCLQDVSLRGDFLGSSRFGVRS